MTLPTEAADTNIEKGASEKAFKRGTAMRAGFTIGLALLSALSAVAAFGAQISWKRDADQAWAEAVKTRRPLMLFATHSGCKFCEQMKAVTFASEEVAAQINAEFVPLIVDPKTDATLIKKLKITAFPTTLIISPGAVSLDRIKGYLPPEEFRKRLSRSVHSAAASQSAGSRR